MKIIILTPHPPYPPNSGGRIRQWELIKYLSERHDVTVVTFVDTEEEYEQRGLLEEICGSTIVVRKEGRALPDDLTGWRKLPWLLRGYSSLEMKSTLERLAGQSFDVVLIENIFMAQYRDIIPAPTVLQEYNIESQVLRQYAEHPETATMEPFGLQKNRAFWNASWRILAAYEDEEWPAYRLRTVVSAGDKMEIDRRCPAGKTVVVENGVNLESSRIAYSNSSRKILFMGTMNYHPNADAVSHLTQSILPLVWKKDPSITACIAGRNMSASIKRLASDSRIEIRDSPQDMHTVAQECSLSVVPIRIGGGTRIKILDAFSMGLPVVSTSVGCEGLVVSNEHHLVIRDEPEQFAGAVVRLVDDVELRNMLRSNARRLIEERYQWQSIFQRLEAEIFSLVHSSVTA